VGGRTAEAVKDLDLVYRVHRRRQPTVHAEDLVVDHSGECEEVEHVGEVGPDVRRAVLAHTLRVEAVRLRAERQP
jgi:hypothetical protein